MNYQERMKYLMQLKGILTLKDLSDKSGVPFTTLDGLMNRCSRSHGPRFDTLQKICAGFGITISEFMGEEKLFEERSFPSQYITQETLQFLSKNINDPDFIEAVEILRLMPRDTKKILFDTCISRKETRR